MTHDPFAQCLKEVKSDKAKREIGVNRKVMRVLVDEITKEDQGPYCQKRLAVTDEHIGKILEYAHQVLAEVLN